MHGTRLVYLTAFALLVLCLPPLLIDKFSEPAIHWALRRSVDIAFPFFFLAFIASSLVSFWPTRFSRWCLRNRRYFGITFAVGFLTHGSLIALLATLYPEPFWADMTNEALYHGIIAFLLTALMLITSNNASVKLLGNRLWSALHTVGGYYLLFSFLGALLLNAPNKPWLWPYFVATVLLIVLRMGRILVNVYSRFAGSTAKI